MHPRTAKNPNGLRMLYGKPVLAYRNFLIISDLHAGMETRLLKEGMHVGNRITSALLDDLIALEKEGPGFDTLVILGDAKDDIYGVTPAVAEFFQELARHFAIWIVKGNHDGNIEALEKAAGQGRIRIFPAGGIVLGNLGLAHGHSWVDEKLMQCDYLVLGHTHYAHKLVSGPGDSAFAEEPVWLVADLDRRGAEKHYGKSNPDIRLIVMPAFNGLLHTRKFSRNLLLKNNIFKHASVKIYTLNGIALGKLINYI